ncbi:1,2-phenylacetyl-CoA epoxidase subunit PaaC [Nocardiopsis trehalosi]|jgi:ring-1,2-phenylacetyl-CoA epoxidase subunit PaaC|uniref:1,2-phenylacetyl-CoA epoxidase subunit PaaC n=1 Tax=Nocardiopsis trehalosi TaxID=109329 RepID=UPI00082A809C|nr:Phenylacetic acid catabolic protein [Nocardiopsis trehalosi]
MGSREAGVDAAVTAYVLRLGDDALIAAHRLREFGDGAGAGTGAPDGMRAEAATAARELADLAGRLLECAGRMEEQLTGVLRSADDLAYGRDTDQYTNCRLVELPNTDAAHAAVRHLLYAGYAAELCTALARSADAAVAGLADGALPVVAGHRQRAAGWTERIGAAAEGRERLAAALAAAWPDIGELFTLDGTARTAAAAGAVPDPAVLRPGWEAAVDAALDRAGLARPDSTPTAVHGMSGRDGVHTPDFPALIADLHARRRG